MDDKLQPLHRRENPGAGELDGFVVRDSKDEAARSGGTDMDGWMRPRVRPVCLSRVGYRPSGAVWHEHRRVRRRSSFVDRRFSQVLISVSDDESRPLPRKRAQDRRRFTAGDQLAAEDVDRKRDEVGRADDVDVKRRLGRSCGGRQQPPAGSKSQRVGINNDPASLLLRGCTATCSRAVLSATRARRLLAHLGCPPPERFTLQVQYQPQMLRNQSKNAAKKCRGFFGRSVCTDAEATSSISLRRRPKRGYEHSTLVKHYNRDEVFGRLASTDGVIC